MEGFPLNNTDNFQFLNSTCSSSSNTIYNINSSEDIIINNNDVEFIPESNKIKNCIIDILNEQTELDNQENDHLNYKNEEIDSIINTLKNLLINFNALQDDLVLAKKNLDDEIIKIKEKIKLIDSSISFYNNLSGIDNKIVENIINGIKELHTKISDNKDFKEAKDNYIKKRKQLDKYIYLIKSINNWNKSSAQCTICLSNTIDHFFNPCGHTFCKSCILEHLKRYNFTPLNDNDLYSMRRDDSTCLICRKHIINIKPLFFS